MSLTATESLIVRYIGQNTTKGEPSDVHFNELESMNGKSWFDLKFMVDDLRERGFLIGSQSKTSFLKLTSKGWGMIEKLKTAIIKVDKKISRPVVNTTRTMNRSSKPTIMITVNGTTMKLTNNISTKLFAGVSEVTVDTEIPDTSYFNNAWFTKKGIKVTVMK